MREAGGGIEDVGRERPATQARWPLVIVKWMGADGEGNERGG